MPEHFTNTQLIEGLQQGNDASFAHIYTLYHQAVFINICKLVANKHEAEDILQEVFIALWHKKATLTPAHSVAGWLFTASYYKSLEHLKKAVQLGMASLTNAMSEAIAADDTTQVFETDYTQKLGTLNAAIELLPPQKKLALKLYRLEGRSYEEVATALNISVESARDYVKSASKLLKRHIASNQIPATVLGTYLWLFFLQN